MTRVLLIEDSRTQAARIRALLEAEGFDVRVAPDGETGLLSFEQERFDLILSDIVLPGLSGYDVCRRIKGLGTSQQVPVVLMTAMEDPQDILRALQSGADNYLSKAHLDEDLVPHLKELLATRVERSQASASDPVMVRFMDEGYAIERNTEQVLDLLVTTFKDNVRARAQLEASHRRLELQNEAQRRADVLRKELSALVVHDLKSPTSGLLMLAQMQLRKADIKDADRVRWRMVFSTAEMLQRMVLNLLDISRSEDGALEPLLSPISLDGLVGEVCEVLQYQFEERRLELQLALEPDACQLAADRELVRRVLLNLLDNACRHVQAGGCITVSATRVASDRVRVAVCNTGSHIAAQFRERVFEKYVRLELHGDEGMEPGRGLGLPFCRTAVEAHGGRIWVEDCPDGTAFCFELPVQDPAQPMEHAPS